MTSLSELGMYKHCGEWYEFNMHIHMNEKGDTDINVKRVFTYKNIS